MENWSAITDDREKYQAYLCSREWCEKREVVRKRSGGICERCNRNRMSHVHHLTYARKYNEDLADLQAVCKECHDFIHAKSNLEPAKNTPLILFGHEIKTVYLAGKIEKEWRESIVSDRWCFIDDDTIPFLVGEKELLAIGPKIEDLTGGHGGVGAHMCGDFAEHGGYSTNRISCFMNRIGELCSVDLVFCWIDKPDAYGSIFEIGWVAASRYNTKARRQLRAIAFVNRDLADQMWLAGVGCDWSGVFPSALSAWEALCAGTNHSMSEEPLIVREDD